MSLPGTIPTEGGRREYDFLPPLKPDVYKERMSHYRASSAETGFVEREGLLY